MKNKWLLVLIMFLINSCFTHVSQGSDLFSDGDQRVSYTNRIPNKNDVDQPSEYIEIPSVGDDGIHRLPQTSENQTTLGLLGECVLLLSLVGIKANRIAREKTR